MGAELIALQRKPGFTTIYVTHDQEEANATADRIAVLDQGRIQQIGAPIDLYDRPANRFVASFLGAANLIEGTIVREGGQSVFKAGSLSIGVPGNPPSGSAALVFRPQSAAISDTSAAPASAAKVVSREFLGTLVRYHIDLGPHQIIVDPLHQRGGRVFATGEEVSLRLDPAQLHVLTA